MIVCDLYTIYFMYSDILICKSPCMDRTWKISLCLHSAILTRMFPSRYGENIKQVLLFLTYVSLN